MDHETVVAYLDRVGVPAPAASDAAPALTDTPLPAHPRPAPPAARRHTPIRVAATHGDAFQAAWTENDAARSRGCSVPPEVPFAKLAGRNLSCKEIGGDFFDAVNTDEGLTIVLADVSGKGVSAALLASTLQGMIYSQLTAGMPLTDIVTAVNRFFTDKNIGEKYATVIIARIQGNGDVEYVNCGHILPLVVSNGEVQRPAYGNLPVGLLPDAKYKSDRCQLKPGDRLVLVTDGVTEAENAHGDFFEDSRLELAAKTGTLEQIFTAISDFCGGTPLSDDCTVVELLYTGS